MWGRALNDSAPEPAVSSYGATGFDAIAVGEATGSSADMEVMPMEALERLSADLSKLQKLLV